MTNANTERNWRIWNMHRITSLYNWKDVGEHFGISSSRAAQIGKKMEERFWLALRNPVGSNAKEVRANINEIHLYLLEEPSYIDPKAQRQMSGPLRDLWTGEYIPGTDLNQYYLRIVPRGGSNVITMTKPKDFVEGEEASNLQALPYDTPIKDLPLPIRARDCLILRGFQTLGDIIGLTDEDLLPLREEYNFGKKSLAELQTFLHSVRGTEPEKQEPTLAHYKRRAERAEAEMKRMRDLYHDTIQSLQREQAYIDKLRGIMSKLTKEFTIEELRKAGVTVDLRVTKD